MTDRLTLVIVGDARAPIDLPQQGRLVIGSGERAHVQLIGQGVADVHCAIGRVKGGGWALQDLGSEFGTLVNGAAATTQKLDAGDEVVIGSRRMRIIDPAAPERAPQPATPPAGAAPSPAPARAEAPRPSAAPAVAAGKATPAPMPRTELAQDELAPVLGGYRIDERLGAGAMGAVYLATQTSLARPVALKVLSPKLASDPHFVERFQAEARAAAALNHPNVVTVYDVGTDDGHHYLAMEFMDAGSLEARLEARGPLPWREVLDVLRDSTSGLVYAEQRRIVHRDIKPDNLMRNREGVTKIADLGLAVQIEAESQGDDHVSEGRRIFGTPHFIAPEVVRGEPADPRSDLYSLGATAYRLLTGHTPFEGATTREILRGVLQDPAPPLGERVIGLPEGVARLVHRLLEKDPGARFPSAQVTLDEIERLRRGETLLPPRPATRSPLPFVLGGLGVVLLAVVAWKAFGGGGGSATNGARPDSPDVVRNGGAQPNGNAGGAATTGGASTNSGGPLDPHSTNPQVPPAGPTAPVTSEAEFELRAEVAFLQLRDRVLTDVERIEALRTLARDFAGTDKARVANEAADALAASLAEAARAAEATAARKDALLAALRIAARLDAQPFLPGRALRDMRLVEGLGAGAEEFGADPKFVAARDALVAEVLDAGSAAARQLLATADEAATRGDLEAMATNLREVVPLGDLPPWQECPELLGASLPQGYVTLSGLVATARERIDGIAGRRTELLARASAEARRAAAEALGGGHGFEQCLRGLDLVGAATRIEGALAALASAPAAADAAPGDAGSAALRTLAEDLRHARALLNALGTGWADPGWKRVSFNDPRATGTRLVTAEAIGADAHGVLVDAGGKAEHIPWAAWANQPRAIESLVNGRLRRDWSAVELRGAATLLRLAAVLVAIDEAAEVLAPQSAAKFSPGESEALLAAYDSARDFIRSNIQDSNLGAALSVEFAAAESFALALRARSDGEWSRAAAAVERLLTEFRGTLLVLALSDGGTN